MTPDFIHCPERGEACYARCPGLTHPHVCQQIGLGNAKYRRLAVERITGEVGPVVQIQPARTPSPINALLVQMKACPSWVPRTDCGCGVNYCSRDSREVSRQDCFTCLKGAEDV